MQYLVLLLAFLAECTLRPAYINTTLTIEIITITYFIILLKTRYALPVYIPALLLLIANIITYEIVGLQSLMLMMASFSCHYIFINGKRQVNLGKQSGKNPMSTQVSIVAFAVSLLIITLLRTIILQMLGHHSSFTSEILYYIINLFVFIVIASCI